MSPNRRALLMRYGTTNASARTWSRHAEGSLYLTKAGKAWLRANDQGRHDFGSSRVMAEMKALLWAKVEKASRVISRLNLTPETPSK